MCEFVSYPTTDCSDTPSNSSPWPLTDPPSYIHPPAPLIAPVPPLSAALPIPNDFSYFQYPPHRHALETPLVASTRENNQHLNEPHPACHYQYLGANAMEHPRPSLPFSRVTVSLFLVVERETKTLSLIGMFLGCCCSYGFCTSSSALSSGKSIGCFVHPASTVVRWRTRGDQWHSISNTSE